MSAIGAVVARFVHTEEVTGSNPVSPTLFDPQRFTIHSNLVATRSPVSACSTPNPKKANPYITLSKIAQAVPRPVDSAEDTATTVVRWVAGKQ